MPQKRTITAGTRFGRLSVLSEDPERARSGEVRWLCRCDCGTERSMLSYHLRTGHTVSCGCWKNEQTGNRTRTHGLSHALPEYRIWSGLRARCLNEKNSEFMRYGGRGIVVCHDWDDFTVFYRDMGPRPSPKHSIDRIDNDGPYAPWNCRWATTTEQGRNRRQNHLVTFLGRTMSLVAWSEATGIRQSTLRRRLKHGWSVEHALSIPPKGQYRNRLAGRQRGGEA
jgi:hypothetical protein